LLGGFAIVIDGEPAPKTAWRLKKARELVKLLALAPGHRLHREQAMEAFWSDREPAAAANNLHQAVFAARRVLGAGAILLRDEVLRLVADVDVDRLERAAADARRAGTPAAYRAALALYGGELLPENRYDDWAVSRRDEVAELAVGLADELSALDSTDRGWSRPLPVDASSFVGRDRELEELTSLLAGTRLLTLAGTGGAGKTRLALELARAAAPSYSGGAALVELASMTDGRLVPDAIAAALEFRALPGQQLVDALVDFLAPRSLLLLLDNCEHLLDSTAGLVGRLLRSAPNLTILVTSREPLHLPAEVVFRVPSLDIPDPEQGLAPSELLGYESVRLLVERAQAAAPGFAIDAANAAAIARICFRLDGLPLALELAAGRLGTLGPEAVAKRLDDRFHLLRAGSRASPSRQHTLMATLQWSHDLLDAGERTLLRRLATFVGGFELDAVEQVCAGGGLDAPDVADVLARLAEKSLVTADDGSSLVHRHRLLETVRAYARLRLDEADETRQLAERHARWALALAERERGSVRLDREAADLRGALDTLLECAPEDALRLCVALLPFWLRRIDLEEAHRRFDQALAASQGHCSLRARALLAAAAIDLRSGALAHGLAHTAESRAVAAAIGDAAAEWRALQFLGELGIASDAVDVATPWIERALEVARREGFAAAEAIGIYSLGVACWIAGDLERADEHVARSIDRLQALGGAPDPIPSPVNIAEIRTSGPAGAPGLRVVFEDTLQPFVELTADAAVSYVLANQAGISRARGDLERARALLDESGARFAASDDEQGTAAVLVRRAYLELAEGGLPAARGALEHALALRRDQRDRRGVGLVLVGLGLVATRACDHRGAARHLAEARELFRRAGDRWGLASTLWRTADLAMARGLLDEAEAALEEARAVLGATQRRRWIASTVAGLADVAVLRGDTARASALLADARDRSAAGDDALGVAGVEERLRSLLSAD
jgi:predicted ATPase